MSPKEPCLRSSKALHPVPVLPLPTGKRHMRLCGVPSAVLGSASWPTAPSCLAGGNSGPQAQLTGQGGAWAQGGWTHPGETSVLGVRLNSRCFSWRALEVHGALPSPAEKQKTHEWIPITVVDAGGRVGLPPGPSRSWGWAEVSHPSCTTTQGARIMGPGLCRPARHHLCPQPGGRRPFPPSPHCRSPSPVGSAAETWAPRCPPASPCLARCFSAAHAPHVRASSRAPWTMEIASPIQEKPFSAIMKVTETPH